MSELKCHSCPNFVVHDDVLAFECRKLCERAPSAYAMLALSKICGEHSNGYFFWMNALKTFIKILIIVFIALPVIIVMF